MKTSSDKGSRKEGQELRKSSHRWRRGFFIFAEILIVCILLVAAGGGLAVWRLKSGPIDLSYLAGSVESSLADHFPDFSIDFDNVALNWPDLSGPVYIGLENTKISTADQTDRLQIEELAFSFDKFGLLKGQIEPLAVILRHPRFEIIKTKDEAFTLGFWGRGGDTGTFSVKTIEDIKNLFRPDIETEQNKPSPATARWLRDLESVTVEHAEIIFTDNLKNDTIRIDDFNWTFYESNKGIHIEFYTWFEDDSDATVEGEAFLGWDEDALSFQTTIENLGLHTVDVFLPDVAEWKDQDITIDAKASVFLDNNFQVRLADIEISSGKGSVFLPDIWEDPVEYQNLGTHLRSIKEDSRTIIEVTSLDLDLNGVKFEGQGRFHSQNSDAIFPANVGLTIKTGEFNHNAIDPLWPKGLKEDDAYEWVVQKMNGGQIKGLSLQTNMHLEDGAGITKDAVEALKVDFAFEKAAMDYKSPLPALTAASGQGYFDWEKDLIHIDILEGDVGGITIEAAALDFTDVVAEGKGDAILDIDAKAPLVNAMRYAATEPIGAAELVDRNMDLVQGQADLKVKLTLPTQDDIKIKDMMIDITGRLTNASVPDLVRGQGLSGGTLDIAITNEKVTLSGTANIDTVPIDLKWNRFFKSDGKPYISQANIKGMASPRLREKLGIDLSDYMEGPAYINLLYTQESEVRTILDIKADLGPSIVFIDPFDYQKPPGEKADITLQAILENDQLKQIKNMSLTGPRLLMQKGEFLFGPGAGQDFQLKRASVGQLVVGETVGTLEVEKIQSGQFKILLQGAFLNLIPFLDNEEDQDKTYEAPPMMISVAVDQMRTSLDETVQFAKLYADIDGQGRFNQLEMDALAGGKDIYMRYKPNEQGMRTFRFEADDAGAALKAFGIYSGIQGGQMAIYGEPTRSVFDRNLIGLAELTNFKVVEAPVLARLLGALSITGALQLLNNDELSFTKLETKFDWLYRREGALLVLSDGRTSGNSLGLTFDGSFDNAAGTINVRGTIILLSDINKIVSSIPVIGDILTGGSGAIFAATYAMKGQAGNPDISVNPVSVLTPGILRRILFEGGAEQEPKK